MQPPPPSPAEAPPAPAQPSPVAAPARTATVQLPDGQLRVPRTAEEIDGLRVRRDMLRDQLSRAQNRRDELVQQFRSGVPDEAKPGMQERLKAADERILQIEQDITVTDRLMANADLKALAESRQREREDRGPMMSEDDAAGMAFGTFGAGVLLAVIVGRVRRRFARRRAAKLGLANTGAQQVADDPRIERLTQAVDAIALEVERIGEGQRFVTQLLATQRPAAALTAEIDRR